jgi:hypothetical protein
VTLIWFWEIFGFIEGFYGRQWFRQSLGYLSTLEFEPRMGEV